MGEIGFLTVPPSDPSIANELWIRNAVSDPWIIKSTARGDLLVGLTERTKGKVDSTELVYHHHHRIPSPRRATTV